MPFILDYSQHTCASALVKHIVGEQIGNFLRIQSEISPPDIRSSPPEKNALFSSRFCDIALKNFSVGYITRIKGNRSVSRHAGKNYAP